MTFKNSYPFERRGYFIRLLQKPPYAFARIKGSSEYSEISGEARFYQTEFGVLVSVQVFGLPTSKESCKKSIFAFHIHGGGVCTGNEEDAFADTLTHYNPEGCEHPYHAGDLPPLFGNDGYAFATVLTDRFSVNEIIGKTIVVHLNLDDFTSQPSGGAGEKIACGQIERYRNPRFFGGF